MTLDKEKKGLFGGGTEQRTEFRRDQFTMDGTRNIGGNVSDNTRESRMQKAQSVSRRTLGARSQGAMAGSAIEIGVAVPAVSSIPYVGWLAGGWALLLGQQAGSTLGSEVGAVFNDC